MRFVHWHLLYLTQVQLNLDICFLWDVKQVLDCAKEKFGENDQLSNKVLKLKVIILLAFKHHLEYQLYILRIYII